MWLLALMLVADSAASLRVPVAARESLHVVVAGSSDGPPVVVVPGLFGSVYGFRHVVPLLTAAGYRTIVIEPLGIGSSSRPPRSNYSLTAQADRLGAVLDTLGVGPAWLVAHSLGGSMALRLAYRRPDLVRGVVLLEGGPAEAAATAGFRRAMRLAPWVKRFGGVRRIQRAMHRSLVAASGDTTWVTDEVVAAYTAGAAADLDATLRAYLGMVEAREPERLAPRLGDVRVPVRLVLGAAAHTGGPGRAERELMRARLPRFAEDTVSGAGHYLHEERAGAVVEAVQRMAGGP
ncbi:MAG: alpha/beta fold hydrolase [Gemmatimonadales bacterium]